VGRSVAGKFVQVVAGDGGAVVFSRGHARENTGLMLTDVNLTQRE
jgi:hypothetical protein